MTRPHLGIVGGGAGSPRWPQALELGALAAGLVWCFTLAGTIPSWSAELGRFQALMAVAFVFLGVGLARMPRYRGLPHLGPFVVVVAFVLRAAVIATPPTLSDDVYRYVWEGRVLAHGQSPYEHAPEDPELAPLRDDSIYPKVNHRELSTIYPPLAEAGFALVASLSTSVLAMKLWILLHDLLLVIVLVRWCERREGSALGAIAYAWNPLLIAEFAGSGHHDPTAMLPLALACYWVDRRPLASSLALSLAVLTKLVPLLALPFLFIRWPWRARALALVMTGTGLAGFHWLTRGEHSGLTAYLAHWRNNESLFHVLALVFGDLRARYAAALIAAGVVAALLMRRVEAADGIRHALRASLLLGPVLHPWYLGWVLMFEPLRISPPWLLLSALAFLSYGVLSQPTDPSRYHLSLAWRVLEYGAPLSLALFLAWRRRRRVQSFGDAP